jgi:type II secretory pathway pseudopilin PulG
MMPDPARSRVERGSRLAGRRDGFSLLEALFVVSLLVTLAGISVPVVLASLDTLRTRGAARYLSGRLNLARMEAVKRSVYVALRIEADRGSYRYTFYADGNRNGVLTRDIAGQIDQPIGPPERQEEKFPGVVFGILPGVTAIDSSDTLEAGGDPIRFGRSDLLSFSPDGTATAGTFYLHGRRQEQVAVRVLGATGRVRVLQFDFNARRWVSQ